MEQVPDWTTLWRQIVQTQHALRANEPQPPADMWATKARWFNENVKRRWDKPDSSRDFLIERLKAYPGSTLLDIGAGTGAWACKLAPYARKVTAVEPSEAMVAVMEENIAELGLTNVEIVREPWPEAAVADHDFSLCSHAMYGCDDVAVFFRRMEQVTLRECILLMRVPTHDGVMAEIARHIWGQPHDSPNFHIAYNALLQMGIYANVLMEERGLWDPWTNANLDEAIKEVKGKMGIAGDEHDAWLRDILGRALTVEGDRVVWPKGVRSALLYWSPVR